MPPSNDIRQPRDIRLWRRSPRMDRRSTLQSAGRDVETGSFSSRRLRARWLASRDGKSADGLGGGGESGDSGDDLSGDDLSGDDALSGDDLSDDDSDVEDDGNVPQQTVTTATSSSGSIVTLTALPPSKATTSLSDVLTTLTPQIATPAPSPPNIIKIVSETTSSMTERPTPTSDFSMDDNSNNNNGDGQKHKGHGDKDNNNNRGLDATAEHLLIAAGAIGAFILFCFIGWIVYRVLKRPKDGGSGFGFIDKLSRRRKGPMEGTWDGRTLYMANEAPPIYEKGEFGTTMSGNFFAPGKAYAPGPGSVARSVASNSETGTLRRPLNDNLAPASMMDQYAENDASSINNNVNLTLRSQMTQMSQPYYNESDMPRQPPGPGNRASQLSSISSGFGDGDIIIPPPLAVQKPLPDPNSGTPNADGAARENPATRDSWVSRDGERRETIYTTTSEDRPARFRSITSWVNQQAGRAKRAGSRARERGEVPVMPAVPGEINMTRQTAYR
ncbi:hypothetical protein Hte_002855 [Hypoxylon texense]